DLGDEAPRLHGHRAKRQPHAPDLPIGNAAAMAAGAPFERVGREAEFPRRARQRGLVGVDGIGHSRAPTSAESLSTRTSCGNAAIQISMATIAPAPPISAEGTAPSSAATVPARNSPSAPEEPVNIELTAITRPSMS